jgi:hypothetical protein
MILNDEFDHDELYWVETESKKDKNIVTKIYVPKNDQTARIRARREQVALNQLMGKHRTHILRSFYFNKYINMIFNRSFVCAKILE